MLRRVTLAAALAALLPMSMVSTSQAVESQRPSTTASTPVTLPPESRATKVLIDDMVVARESMAPDVRSDVRALPRLRPEKRIKIIVLRSYSRGRPPAHPTKPELTTLMKKVGNFFQASSRGKQKFRFSISKWVKLPKMSCNMLLRREPLAAARRAGYNLRKYNRLMVMQPQCDGFASYGERPGAFTWINFGPDFQTLVHELGHNVGLTHAQSRLCKQDGHAVVMTGKCQVIEYGDVFDPMGNMGATSFSSASLKRLGWGRRTATVTGSGTYELGDTTAPGPALQAVRVVEGSKTFWVEYLRRDPQEPEDGEFFEHGAGVLVRQDTGGSSLAMFDGSPGSDDTFLDAYSPADPALQPGSSFTTPAGTRIAVLSAGATAKVLISRKTTPGVPNAPLVTGVTHNSDYGVVHVDVQPGGDNGEVVLGYRVTFQPQGRSETAWTPLGPGGFDVEWNGGNFATASVRAINRVGVGPSRRRSYPHS